MRHQRRGASAGLPADQRQHGRDLAGRLRRTAERRTVIGRLAHRRVAAAFAETGKVEGPGVEAARVPIVQPGTAAKIEADGQRRRKGGAVDVETAGAPMSGRRRTNSDGYAPDAGRRKVCCVMRQR